MAGNVRQFYCLRLRRPKHPSLKRRWRKWCGEVRVDSEDQRVFIVDVMQPHHLMAKLPPIGSPQCFEHDHLAFVDIDWGIKNATDAEEREHYRWLKAYALNHVAGDTAEPYLQPVYPKISGRGRNMTLMLEDGRHCDVAGDLGQVAQMLRHLARKTWCNDEFLRLAIDRIATARGWKPESITDEFHRGSDTL